MSVVPLRRSRVARLVVALAAVLAIVPAVPAGVSPGPLARAHEKLDGVTRCTSCHRPGAGSMRDDCLACHREISWLMAQRRGLHAREPARDCTECHAEHAGRDAALVRFEQGAPERFDHSLTGWPVEGRHAKVKCRDCHKPALQRGEALRISKRADRTGSYLGLERECASCHEDRHRNTPAKDCARCHAPAGWKPALAFDHGRTRYPLTGNHARVACFKCHRETGAAVPAALGAAAVPLFGPVPHDECSACHADPHAGRRGGSCARCHNTEGFRRVDRKVFDHERTRYPLRGRHATVDCARCHDPQAAPGTRPQFAACASCHRDPHGGKALLAGARADCAACHVVDGFRPSTFTVARHEAAAFPLRGKHALVKCEGCHTRDPATSAAASPLVDARVRLRPLHDRCGACHADPHGGQLLGRADRGECGSCHRPDGWKPSTFTAKEHAGLRVDLSGKHATLSCAACHAPDRKGLPPPMPVEAMGKARVALALGEGACATCHASPHGAQFASRADGGACAGCHDTYAFRPATRFDHNRDTRFPLLRSHASVACARCHPQKAEAAGRLAAVYRPLSSACKDCHLALKVVPRSEGSLASLGS